MSNIPTLTFGKYKNRKLDQIPLNYIIWLANVNDLSCNANKYIMKNHKSIHNFCFKCIYDTNVKSSYVMTSKEFKGKNINDINLEDILRLVKINTSDKIPCINYLVDKIQTVMPNFGNVLNIHIIDKDEIPSKESSENNYNEKDEDIEDKVIITSSILEKDDECVIEIQKDEDEDEEEYVKIDNEREEIMNKIISILQNRSLNLLKIFLMIIQTKK